MRDSPDQSATEAIATGASETGATGESPAPPKAEVSQGAPSSAGKNDSAAGEEAKAGLPVPMVLPLQAEVAKAATGEASTPRMAQSAAPRVTAAEARFERIPFRSVPPRQKKPLPPLQDLWFKAAVLAVALGIGWIAGANTFDRTDAVQQLAVQLRDTDARLAAVSKTAHAGPGADLAAVKSDLAALKKNVDGLGKSVDTQRAGLGTTKAGIETTRGDIESVKAGLQAAQAGLDASKTDMSKVDRLAERIDRLERQVSSTMPTGSIAAASAAPAAAQSAASAAKDPHALPTGAPKAAVDKSRIPPNGYVLRDVHDGIAVVEDHTGLREIVPGEMLAGIGRVEAIERHGGRWVVVTSNGLIDSEPY